MNAKLLETLIKQGHQVAVKHKCGFWKVFLFIYGDGYFQGSRYLYKIEDALRESLSGEKRTKQEIEEYFTNEYKVVTPAPLLLQPGDKVEILENVRGLGEKEGWCENKMEMIGKKGFYVYGVDVEYYFIDTEDGSVPYYFPHRAVAKFEGGENEDILIKDGKKYRVQILEEIE